MIWLLLLPLILHPAHSLHPPPRPHAIVVGAGPVGLATSLILASHHNYNVTLLESSPSSQANYDPTKAFLYNVNPRGQTLTKMFPSMHAKLVERSVPSRGFGGASFTIVPSDPGVSIPKTTGETSAETTAKTTRGVANSEKAVGVGYWIPRHDMVQLMVECMEEYNLAVGEGGRITFRTGMECISVAPGTDSGVSLTVRDVMRDETVNFHATLVVGADGMNSKVRECLSRVSSDTWSPSCRRPKDFSLLKWTSPASFLRIKVLQLPPQFKIPDADGPPLVTRSENIYAIRSIHNGPRNYISLGLLPMKNNTAVRPTNVVTRPDHEVWKIRDGKAMQAWFETAFPRMNFQSNHGLISQEEWDRFAKAEGTRFPSCQYSPGHAVWNDSGTGGVALVGDAIHAFPPDIGQGVNAGLMDVVCLHRALSGLDTVTGKGRGDSRGTLGENLKRYQIEHSPETAALIRLARFGAPYQYRQPHRVDRVLRMLWTANVGLRLVLSKVTFGLIQPTCIVLSQRSELTFRQVMRRADASANILKVLLLGLVGLGVRRSLGLVNVVG